MTAAQQSQEDYINHRWNAAMHYKIDDKVWLDLQNIKINKLIKKAAKYCKSKLLKYYNKTNDSYLISIILDPRFKMQYFKDKDWDDKLIDEINQKYILFNCFKNFCFTKRLTSSRCGQRRTPMKDVQLLPVE